MLDFVGLPSMEPTVASSTNPSARRRQLGLANPLPGDPHFLIHDEPANGLGLAADRAMPDLMHPTSKTHFEGK